MARGPLTRSMPHSTRARRGLFVGIDLGTSGIRIAAIDQNGRVRGTIARAWPRRRAMDPGAWREMTLDLLARLLRRIDRTQVRALAVDGTSGTVMLCGSCGTPRGQALAYDDDRACAEARVVAAVAPPSVAAGAGGGPAKLLWLRARRLGAQRALTQAGFVSGCLTGRYTICDEHNALKLGADGSRWPEWLRTLGLASLLPPITAPGTPVGHLRPSLCRRPGLRHAPWVIAGTTDSTAGILALGPLPVGTAVTTLGSTLVLKVVSPVRAEDPDKGNLQPSPGGVLAGGRGIQQRRTGAAPLFSGRGHRTAVCAPALAATDRPGLLPFAQGGGAVSGPRSPLAAQADPAACRRRHFFTGTDGRPGDHRASWLRGARGPRRPVPDAGDHAGRGRTQSGVAGYTRRHTGCVCHDGTRVGGSRRGPFGTNSSTFVAQDKNPRRAAAMIAGRRACAKTPAGAPGEREQDVPPGLVDGRAPINEPPSGHGT